jgi:hypothetical protein
VRRAGRARSAAGLAACVSGPKLPPGPRNRMDRAGCGATAAALGAPRLPRLGLPRGPALGGGPCTARAPPTQRAPASRLGAAGPPGTQCHGSVCCPNGHVGCNGNCWCVGLAPALLPRTEARLEADQGLISPLSLPPRSSCLSCHANPQCPGQPLRVRPVRRRGPADVQQRGAVPRQLLLLRRLVLRARDGGLALLGCVRGAEAG